MVLVSSLKSRYPYFIISHIFENISITHDTRSKPRTVCKASVGTNSRTVLAKQKNFMGKKILHVDEDLATR